MSDPNASHSQFYNLNRWCNVRFDSLAAVFSSGLAAYLVYGPGERTASAIGFTLSVSVQFSTLILWFVRVLNVSSLLSFSLLQPLSSSNLR